MTPHIDGFSHVAHFVVDIFCDKRSPGAAGNPLAVFVDLIGERLCLGEFPIAVVVGEVCRGAARPCYLP